jgi:hypothetical protein
MGGDERSIFEGLDGKAYLTEEGVVFERSKMSARSRSVEPVHHVPWAAVVGASAAKGYLRVQVAGAAPARIATGDPHTVGIRRGEDDLAAMFVDSVSERAAGASATPIDPPPPERAAAAPSPVAAAVPDHGGLDEVDQALMRTFKVQERFQNIELALVVGACVFVLLVVVVLGVALLLL